MMKQKESVRPLTVYLKESEYDFIEDQANSRETNMSVEMRYAVRELMLRCVGLSGR